MGETMLVAMLLVEILKKYLVIMLLATCCSTSIATLCQSLEGMTKDEMTLKRLQ